MKFKKRILTLMTVSIFNSLGVSSFAISGRIQGGFIQQPSTNTTTGANNTNTNDLDNIKIPTKDFGCSAKINEILSKIEYYLTEYKSNKNLIYLNKSIELFGDIAVVSTENDIVSFEYNAPVYNAFENIRSDIYAIQNEATCSEYLVKFAERILFGWRKNKVSSIFPDYFLAEGLVEYNTITEKPCVLAQDKLDAIYSAYAQMINTNEGNTDSEEMPDLPVTPENDYKPLPPIDFDDETYAPENNISGSGNSNTTIEIPEDSYTYSTEYKKVGSSCVLVETKYKDGLSFEQTEKPVSKEDYVHCGIYDYIFDNVHSSNTKPNNSSNNFIIDDEYINSDQNEESNMYIFYTVSKDSFTPYYYNSGIRATSEGTVTYNQLKDALYQVAIKSNGFSTDTNDKSLAIIEGIPIVVDSNQDIYSKKYVEKLLSSFKKVGFKIDKEIEQSQSDLEKLISNNEIISIQYNDKDIQIDNLKIQNSFIIAPIETIATLFDYKVDLNDTELTITKEGFKLKLMLNDNKYILNNEEFNLDSNVIRSKNELYMDISYLFELLGYDITWNNENLCFEVEDK